MLIQISGILPPEALRQVRKLLGDAPFVDGRKSAGLAARRVKDNLELEASPQVRDTLNRIVVSHLAQDPTFRSAALPHRVSDPIFSRYEAGMGYGDHIDDPIMGAGPRYRSDLALTLFLSGSQEYDGGELVIRTSFGTQAVKLDAGDLVLYPASSLHRVAPLTRGERLVAVAWVQSLVRDPVRRELLFGLDQARQRLLRELPQDDATARVDHTYVNLVRMWAEL